MSLEGRSISRVCLFEKALHPAQIEIEKG